MAKQDLDSKPRALPPIPRGLQDVLVLAGGDPAFRAALTRDPEAALAERDIRLSAREHAILRAVPREQLNGMIQNVADPGLRRRRLLAQSAASAAALLGAAGLIGVTDACKSKADVDLERPTVRAVAEEGGISPHFAPKCDFRASVGKFATTSGPDRSPGEADIERLRAQLAQTCGAESVDKPGKLTYEVHVGRTGAVTEVKTVENTTGQDGLDVIMKRHLEKIVFFDAGEPSVCNVTLSLE
jgi:hypothetical protein